eukprot:TRINITY_DN1499_c0_g1_i3.p1 TRINITY_DN1499_c0_g1~~TRINITY_DN1499_c0_g1_i3.p1  ORF type:complete len:1359 (-),score=404.78 TRINITY_DN1499_c0_g1_i3:3-4079(-)
MTDWKSSYSQAQRDRLVLKITEVLREAVLGDKVADTDIIRLTDAARQLEAAIFKKATHKNEYAQGIAERVIKIKNRTKISSQPSARSTPTAIYGNVPRKATSFLPTSPTTARKNVTTPESTNASTVANQKELSSSPQSAPVEESTSATSRPFSPPLAAEYRSFNQDIGNAGKPATSSSERTSSLPNSPQEVHSKGKEMESLDSILNELSHQSIQGASGSFVAEDSQHSWLKSSWDTTLASSRDADVALDEELDKLKVMSNSLAKSKSFDQTSGAEAPITSPVSSPQQVSPVNIPSGSANPVSKLLEVGSPPISPTFLFFKKKQDSSPDLSRDMTRDNANGYRDDVDVADSEEDGFEEEELNAGEGEISIKFSLFTQKIQMLCREAATLASVKSQLWAVASDRQVEMRKQPQDYVFQVDGDDFLMDESAALLNTPYVLFCRRMKLVPYFRLTERSKYKLSLKIIGAIIGKPLCWNVEQSETDAFRKEMTTIRYTKYGNRPKFDASMPTYLPAQFSVRVFLSSNIQFKTMNCEASQTVSETLDLIFRNYGKLLQNDLQRPLKQKEFVLKLRGIEEYFLDGSMKLIFFESVRSRLRRQQKIELVLAEKKSLPIPIWEKLTDYHVHNKVRNEDFQLEDILVDFDQDTRIGASITENEKPLRIKFIRLEGFYSGVVEALGLKPQQKGIKMYITATLYHFDQSIAEVKTEDTVYQGGNQPLWSVWVEGLPYKCIPWGAVIHIVVWCRSGKKSVSVGWLNFQTTDYRNKLKQGYQSLPLLSGVPDPRAYSVTDEKLVQNYKICFEIEIQAQPQCFYIDTPNQKKLEGDDQIIYPDAEEKEKMLRIFSADPLYIPSDEEKQLLWRFRNYCCRVIPNSVVKFVWCIPWGDCEKVQQAYSLIQKWPVLESPVNALELLKPRFIDKKIREYTVRNLQQLTDTELSDYLLQLIQALKHEIHHDSPLARFLLHRALLNRNQIGHDFFWCLKSELQSNSNQLSERFEMLLEAYLRGCGSFREELLKQTALSENLSSIAAQIKNTKDDKRRKAIILKELSSLKLPKFFQVTINPTYYANGFVLDKCKYYESKTTPLRLVFENIDSIGDPIDALYKAGDDLRQDQLTLRMISIMDKMWLKEGLDLRILLYKCIATGQDVGWIEVVQNSATTADIQKEAGGISEIFNEKTIARWLRQHNPSDLEYNIVVDNFIRSCAGCCVATYVIGIGDRHNDNIMINKTGHLFHIDFGKFLGNAQMFLNIKRDRAPFVFTPDMAFVMGGTNSEKFQFFVDLCCKAYLIVRRNSSIFINLFAMMLGTGIPELSREEDLNYLRLAFSLDMTEEEASKKFTRLISESLNTKAIQFNFAIHLLANAQ